MPYTVVRRCEPVGDQRGPYVYLGDDWDWGPIGYTALFDQRGDVPRRELADAGLVGLYDWVPVSWLDNYDLSAGPHAAVLRVGRFRAAAIAVHKLRLRAEQMFGLDRRSRREVLADRFEEAGFQQSAEFLRAPLADRS